MADSKVVAYKLLSALGDCPAGEVIHLEEDKGDALVKAGLAELAPADDVADAEDEAEMDDSPVIANSINKLKTKVEAAVADSVAKVIKKPVEAPVAATLKSSPYRSNGSAAIGYFRAKFKGDTTELNKIQAWNDEAAKVWNKRGIVTKSPLGIQEGTNASGGYLVNPEFSKDVYTAPINQIDLIGMAEKVDAQGYVYNQRFVNFSSLANGSVYGGLNQVATAEGASFTSSLPAWNNVTFTLQKLAYFIYYTSEVLQDASYPIEQEIDDMVMRATLLNLNTQFIQGSTLEGILNTPAYIAVTASSNDTAWHTTPSTSLTYADLANIFSAVYPDCQASEKGIWLFHPSLANCLMQMTYTFSGSNPAWGIQYNAEQGLSGNGALTPYKIFGKNAYPCWACSAPGTAGDILYVDMACVKNYCKAPRIELSKEFQFGTDQVAIRYVNRLDCRAVFRNTITGVNGTQQFSAFVGRTAAGT